ncbi:MAG: DUF4838 domain-containing protein [Ruminococcaceae bacterium]|nr:DUF4838 domain-containing protein [Oscillospiraceae bacterium]
MKLYRNDAPICFAKSELERILPQMTDADLSGLQLGLLQDFPQITPKNTAPTPLDDEIYLNVSGFCGIIAGNNPRAVLIAAYRYLTELGVRFLNVGRDGEKIPKTCDETHTVKIHEIPSYRHRGVCIEGAVSVENVIEMVDFLPKLGMNTYFIQFREAHTFFERWYSHTFNLFADHPEYTVEESRAYVRDVENAMRERGIVYQAVGHGWTCEPFGVPGLGWDKWTDEIAPEVLENFAMVNGVRGLADGITLNTHACYSNPKVRQTIIDDICRYVKDHPTLNVLHFWLADGVNCVCECENCKKMRPSDMYITLLNDIDEALAKQGSDIKVVFLLYLDLLWPPLEQKLKNPDRFIMMFAPITRSYNSGFGGGDAVPELDPYVYNDIILPNEPSKNVAYLRAWQEAFGGDSFDYDYHYMWAFAYDPGMIKLARVLSEDIKNLKVLGLDGFISCQIGRVMFPNGLNMTVMGKTLWDRTASFENICAEYFRDCYGEQGEQIQTYLGELSTRFSALDLEVYNFSGSNGSAFEPNPEKAKAAAETRAFLEAQPAFSDRALEMHRQYCIKLCGLMEALYLGDDALGKAKAEVLRRHVWETEKEFQNIFDGWSYENVYRTLWKI